MSIMGNNSKILKVVGGSVVALAGVAYVVYSLISPDKVATSINYDDYSHDELRDLFMVEHEKWRKTGWGGNGEKSPEMKRLEKELSKRSYEEWLNNPHRNTDPNYRWTDANRWE